VKLTCVALLIVTLNVYDNSKWSICFLSGWARMEQKIICTETNKCF